MADFKPLRPHQLARLSDDALVDYLHAARVAGEAAAEREAAAYLAYAFEPTIRGWVARSTPPDDVEDVVMEVIASALRTAFDGRVVGQFGSFLKQISRRRVADHFRERGRRLDTGPLPEEHSGDDVWGTWPSDADEGDAVALADAVDRVLAGLNPLHRKVVRLYFGGMEGFEDLPADGVCARLAAEGERVSPDNVAKIASRFREALREELDV